MEYSTIIELYKALIPAFNVKRRLLKFTKHENITNKDIFKYLAVSKWQNSYDLTIAQIVNDIITLDVEDLIKERGA